MKHFTTGRIGLALLATGVLFLSLTPVASAAGGNSANAKLCQKGGWAKLYDADTGLRFTSRKDCREDAANNEISSLTLHTFVLGGTGWWTASGFGLKPGTPASLTVPSGVEATEQVSPDGTVSIGPDGVLCGLGLSGYATATTSKGATITTPSLPEAC